METATETPAFLGCPQHMPTKLPGGFDGTEPAPSDEAKKALADGVERMRDKLSKIADIALAADAKCVNIEKIGKRWMECSKAICEIRKICGPDLIEKAVFSTGMYYTPGWLANLAKEVAARQKPVDPTAPEVVNPSRLEDIGMQMGRTTVVDDDGVVCKIRRAGVLMMGIGRPAQIWEIDATKHPTYCRVMIYCDHKPIFDGKAFGKNIHRADHLGLAVMIRFIQAQRKHQRANRKAAVKKLIKEELA